MAVTTSFKPKKSHYKEYKMSKEKHVDNSIYIDRNGIIEPIEKPSTGFGKTIIHWQDGKPVSQEVTYTKLFEDKPGVR